MARTALLAALALPLAGGPAAAAFVFTATLTHQQEVPATPDRGFSGTAVLVLDDAMTALTYTVTVFGPDVTGMQTPDPTDNLTLAHIHAPGPPGVNGPIVFGFFGSPFNDTNPNDFVLAPFAGSAGGTFSGKWDLAEGNNTTLAAQLPNLFAGNAYLNFHTARFPGGEIRGQITPVVPEPGSLALLGAGVIGLAAYARRRRAAAPEPGAAG